MSRKRTVALEQNVEELRDSYETAVEKFEVAVDAFEIKRQEAKGLRLQVNGWAGVKNDAQLATFKTFVETCNAMDASKTATEYNKATIDIQAQSAKLDGYIQQLQLQLKTNAVCIIKEYTELQSYTDKMPWSAEEKRKRGECSTANDRYWITYLTDIEKGHTSVKPSETPSVMLANIMKKHGVDATPSDKTELRPMPKAT